MLLRPLVHGLTREARIGLEAGDPFVDILAPPQFDGQGRCGVPAMIARDGVGQKRAEDQREKPGARDGGHETAALRQKSGTVARRGAGTRPSSAPRPSSDTDARSEASLPRYPAGSVPSIGVRRMPRTWGDTACRTATLALIAARDEPGARAGLAEHLGRACGRAIASPAVWRSHRSAR